MKLLPCLVLFLAMLIGTPALLGQETAEAFYNQALEAKKRGKYDEVIRLLDHAVRLNSNYIKALLERSEAKQNNQRDLDGAMADLETVLQIDPANGKAYFARAGLRNDLIHRMLKKEGGKLMSELMPYWQEILDDVNSAISNGYGSKQTFAYRADLLSGRFHRYPEAIADYDEALILDPKDTGLYLNRSAAKYRSDDFHGAAEDMRAIVRIYEEAIAVESTSDDEKARLKRMAIIALNNLSSIYSILEQTDKQLEAIEESLALEPNHAGYAARGRHHMIYGELNEAIKDYTTAIELSAGTQRAHHLMNRGIVYTLSGEPEKADADFAEGRKDPQLERYNLEYWLELSKRQRAERRVKVKLSGSK